MQAEDPAHAARRGAWATPPEVARRMAAALPAGARVLDPACGAGSLLLAVAERAWREEGASTPEARAQVLDRRIHGWELEPDGAEAARVALAVAAGVPTGRVRTVRCRDALADPCGDTFDAVITNPPWVSSARLALEPGLREALASRFATARGNWDLYCPFVERAVGMLRPGGTLVALLPEAVRVAPYARALRALLHGVLQVRSLESVPDVVLGVGTHGVLLVAGAGPGLPLAPGGLPWSGSTHATLTLGDLAEVHGAATVEEAYRWAEEVREGAPDAQHLPLVNTGTLGQGAVLWGERPIRYLGRRLLQPVVPTGVLSARRLEIARAPKVIVPGLVRPLRAVADPEGRWLPGKSTVVVRPHDPRLVQAVADWLCSPPIAAAYADLATGLALRGGWLRVTPTALASLPWDGPTPPPGPTR